MIKELKKRDDRDDEHRGDRPTASNFSSTLLSALPLSQPPAQTSNSTGFVPKKRSCISETALMLFDVFSNNPVIKFFCPEEATNRQPLA